MTTNEPSPPETVERYMASRFDWAAPGDQQEDAWLVRFCDKDCGEAVFTGPDAEREAWEHYERYAPSFNIYVFRLARLRPDTRTTAESASCEVSEEVVERVATALAKVHGLDYHERCPNEADPIDGECDSGTCIAAYHEDHDADLCRSDYRALARAAIAAVSGGVVDR